MKITWKETTQHQPWIDVDMINGNVINSNIKYDNSIQKLIVTDSRDQEIEGFGGCFNELGWIALNKVSKKQREDIMMNLFDQKDGAKFNFCRTPIGASDYAESWYSLCETENDFAMDDFSIDRDLDCLIPFINSAKDYIPELKLFASPWSPPTWMKYPKVYNHGRLIMEEEYLNAYALYFTKYIEAYKEKGININQIHIQNEPFADQKFPSCVWTGEQFRVFISKYLGPLFEEKKINSEIWLGTLNGPEQMKFLPTGQIVLDLFDEYIDHILFDKNAKKYIAGIGYQWAGREAIQRTRESYPEMRLMQTENECGDGNNTWEYARYVFNLMQHYFKNGISSYTYWNMVLEDGGHSTWGWKQNSLISIKPETKEVIYNPEFFLMKHFSHYAKSGAKRIELKGPWSGSSVAFENPDNEIILVVANNLSYNRQMNIIINDQNVVFELKGFSFNTITISQ